MLDAHCAAAKKSVWMLCTKAVWPGDLSTFLWSQYGANVSRDLDSFRLATRTILDEYTAHFSRQAVVMEDFEGSLLSDLVLLDRLDRIKDVAGFPQMAAL